MRSTTRNAKLLFINICSVSQFIKKMPITYIVVDSLLDAYKDFCQHRDRDSDYECKVDEARIHFLASVDPILIHYINIASDKRKKGLFTALIQSIVADASVNRIVICGVGTELMISCLAKIGSNHGLPFKDQGGDFIWTRPQQEEEEKEVK